MYTYTYVYTFSKIEYFRTKVLSYTTNEGIYFRTFEGTFVQDIYNVVELAIIHTVQYDMCR